MWGKVGVFGIILVLLVVPVLADVVTPAAPSSSSSIDQSNKFLSAEVARQMQAGQDAIIKSVNDNNDQNFALLDQRTSKMLSDTRMQVIIGGIGAILIAQAIIGIIMIRAWRRYSFEYYQEQIIGKQQATIKDMKGELAATQQFQQKEYYPQDVPASVSTVYGQAAAGDMTSMNQWQMQAAHNTGWVSPQQPSRVESNALEQGGVWVDNGSK